MSDTKDDFKPRVERRHELLMEIKDHLEGLVAEFVDEVDTDLETEEVLRYFFTPKNELSLKKTYLQFGGFLRIRGEADVD